MPCFKTTDGVEQLQRFIQNVGGTPKEWYVGITHDALSRLERRGMRDNPSATWISCEDEQTARAIEKHLLSLGVQSDMQSGHDETPPTQVYLFRAPRLTSFREWLKGEEQKDKREGKRREIREDWVGAVNRFLDRCRTWLSEIDSEGILSLRLTTQEKAEIGLGRYEVPLLVIEHDDTRIHVAPVARNTARTLTFAPGVETPALGRVDISSGIKKWIAYRANVEGAEHWYVVPDRGELVELNQDSFLAIMEDLLS